VPSEVLFPVFDSRAAAHQPKPTLLYCTDHAPAGQIAATLITDLGFEPQNAGPLRIARLLEPFALLVAQLAYEMLPNPELAYRFTPFTKRR
jgi:predicted dinucleotide-binding enzyme